MRLTKIGLGAALAVSLFLLTDKSHAQATGFAVNRFEPSERGSSWFALESLDLRGKGRPALGVVGDYQYRPLAIYDRNGEVRSSVVGHMLTTHVGGAVTFADRFRLALSMPFVLYEEGDTGRLNGVVYERPRNEQALGDLRLGGDIRLFGEHDAPITAALGVQAWLPTGDTQSYTSDGRFRFQPRATIAGQVSAFVYAVKLGVMIRDPEQTSFAGSPVGHEFTYGVAAGLRVADNRLTIGPELFGSTVLTEETFKTRTTPFEGVFGGHYNFEGGLRVGAGAGLGLTRGYGAPQARVLLSIDWMPEIDKDRDGDGVLDKEDACPDTPGIKTQDPKTNGCPPPPPADRDHDGILDKDDACPDTPGKPTEDKRTNGCADKDGDGIFDPLDACPDVPGIPSDDPKLNGCPEPDTDKDGVLDKEDACIDTPGVRTQDPKTNGCPPDPDRDKDGIPNDTDACPDEPGKPDPDPKKNGCPKAFVSQGQIKILDQVKFKTGSAEILPGPDSEEVLQAVLKVMNEHPEIKKVRVEGHTDDRGGADLNRKLSQNRAGSVVKYLVKKGIAADRLTSAGFGPDRPIDTNVTDEGRRNNRRVEFHIEQQDAPPAPPK